MSLGDSDLGTTERPGATGKGREEVILSILDSWELRSCFMVPKYRKKGLRDSNLGENERAGATGKGREGVILSILDTWILRLRVYTP